MTADSGGTGAVNLRDLLEEMIKRDASDLHITVGAPPIVRRYGDLLELPREPLRDDEAEDLLLETLEHEQRVQLQDELSLEFSYDVPDQGRYRSCIVRQRLGWNGAFRVIRTTVPSFDELGLPAILKQLVLKPRGLVLVTGPTGSGKSTTLAAMINHLNENDQRNVIIIEDPIEFLHCNKRCIIAQRDLGDDTKSFSTLATSTPSLE